MADCRPSGSYSSTLVEQGLFKNIFPPCVRFPVASRQPRVGSTRVSRSNYAAREPSSSAPRSVRPPRQKYMRLSSIRTLAEPASEHERETRMPQEI